MSSMVAWMALGLAATLVSAACESSVQYDNPDEFTHEHLNPRLIQGQVLNEQPILGRPSRMELSRSVLWVKDGTGDPYLHALDASSGRIIRSVGRKGEGPGEFEGVFDVSTPAGHPGAVWAFDLQQQRLTLVDARTPPEEFPLVHLQGEPRVVRAAWISPTSIIGVNERPETRFVRFDSTGARVSSVAGSLLGDQSAPGAERRKATITGFSICPTPAGGFAIAYRTAGRIELYSPEAVLLDTASVPYPSQPHFELGRRTRRPQFVYDRLWYVGCDATRRYLYAAFSGRRFDAFEEGVNNTGQFLHVFSSDGELTRVYQLDPAVSGVQVDSSGTTLYGSSLATAKIYRFTLPSIP